MGVGSVVRPGQLEHGVRLLLLDDLATVHVSGCQAVRPHGPPLDLEGFVRGRVLPVNCW